MFSLVHSLPSPASAELRFASLFGWFTGTMPQSDSSPPCAPAVRLTAFSGRPADSAGGWEVSRFSWMLFLGVPRAYDYGGFSSPSRYRSIRCCLPLGATRSASPHGFSKLNLLAHRCLCLRFRPHLALVTARLEVRMVRYFFPAGLFHPLQHAGLSRRSAPPYTSVDVPSGGSTSRSPAIHT